jgi:carbon-monoxide dehydrogenase medium subunit
MQYFRPKDLDEAYALLARHGHNAIPLAGNSFFMGHREELFDEVDVVVDIKRLGLGYLRIEADGLHLGATLRLAEILGSEALRASPYRVLAETVGDLNIKEVRNVATVGGELCIAGEVDLPTTLLALDAAVVIGSARGERRLPLEKFHKGYLSTALEPGEIVKEAHVPPLPVRSGAGFRKFERTYADLPLVNVAVRVTTDAAGVCTDARIAVGAAVAVPVRSKAGEAALIGRKLDGAAIAGAAAATSDVECTSDIRASGELRGLWVRAGTEDALTQAARIAAGGEPT